MRQLLRFICHKTGWILDMRGSLIQLNAPCLVLNRCVANDFGSFAFCIYLEENTGKIEFVHQWYCVHISYHFGSIWTPSCMADYNAITVTSWLTWWRLTFWRHHSIAWKMLTYFQWGQVTLIWMQLREKYFSQLSLNSIWKIIYLTFHPNIPGDNEFNKSLFYDLS